MKNSLPLRYSQLARLFLSVTVIIFIFIGCRKNIDQKALRDFGTVNLVDNGHNGATHQDTSLINAWGIAWAPSGIAWVNAHDGGVSALYDKDGASLRAPIRIPSPTDTSGGEPTGIVFNGSSDFMLSNGQPARFIFVGEDGVLSGWNGAAGNNAIRIQDHSADAAFTGLAYDSSNGAHYIYAADLKKASIDVWDKNFMPVSMSFTDPNLPAGYGPFNIQSIGNWLFVTYAKKGPDGDEEKGAGNGIVSVFSPDGQFVKRFASHGVLNAPWGVAMAPVGFFEDNDMDADDSSNGHGEHGQDGNRMHSILNIPTMLIGNFGDGKINVFSMDGQWLGQVKSHGHALVIDGLWALSFPPSTATSIDPKRLYFAAGPNDETNGLFGYIIKQ